MSQIRTTGPIGTGGGGGGAGIVIVGAIVAGFAFGWGNVLLVFGSLVQFAWHGILTLGWSVLVGVWKGIFLSSVVAIQVVTHFSVGHPHLYAIIVGVISGLVIGWLRTAWRSKGKYDPLISAVFSSEPFERHGWELLIKLLANVVVGYIVANIFSGMITGGWIHFTTHDLAGALIYAGGGPFGGGGGDYTSDFILVLVAFIILAMFIAATSGGALGSAIGAVLWKIDVSHVLFGSAQGTVVHLLTGRVHRSGKLRNYVIGGAIFGAVEGLFVGAGIGIVVTLLPG